MECQISAQFFIKVTKRRTCSMNFLKFKEAPANTVLIASPWEPKRKSCKF